ncbi:MAG: hypothetical protein QNI87_08900 [Erythrobacter sp.]|uniref:hypothetical protein n=1 Tax=Erythrobacter sp. TaxID=1042 RepID=UPI002638CAF4|nr:hypothetical protein [Erythrobacter sp.]MDJ0978642.1 hypothetical protein [Erythrobacter sp.]
MRIFVEILENFADGVRLIVGVLTLIIMGTVLVFTFGASYVATGAAEEIAEHAEEVGKGAIRAQIAAERNRELAKDGWGYEAASGAGSGTGVGDFGAETGPDRARRARQGGANDWGSAE